LPLKKCLIITVVNSLQLAADHLAGAFTGVVANYSVIISKGCIELPPYKVKELAGITFL
jgi:hypothetical protein